MNDRQRAIQILQEARDLLSARLTERILESESEILEDAQGEHYLSEIESLYDQLGSRLSHVSNMLAHLPPVTEAVVDMADGDVRSSDWLFGEVLAPPGGCSFLALPPPPRPDHDEPLDPARELHGFLRNVHRGDLGGAALVLVLLLKLDLARAQRCADVFAVQAALRPELYTRLMRLKGELASGNHQGGLLLLRDCFGLDALEASAAMLGLRRRLGLITDAQVW